MNWSRPLGLVLSLSVLLALAACQGAAPAATPAAGAAQEMKLTNWRLASTMPVNSSQVQLYLKFAAEAEKRTNGKLKITVFPGDSLGYGSTDMARVMQAGLAEMAEVQGGAIAGDSPVMVVTELPALIPKLGDAEVAFKTAGPYYQKVFDKFNSTMLMSWARPMANVAAKRPVQKLEDFKGLKIRTWSPELTKTMQALGATPVSMPASDTYMSISTGVLDGVIWSASSVFDYKVYEVAPHYSSWNLTLSSFMLTVNKTALAALPQNVQKMLIDLGAELQPEAWKTIFYADADNLKTIQERGMKVYPIDAAESAKVQALMPAVWNDWLTKSGADGKAVLNDVLKATGRPALQ